MPRYVAFLRGVSPMNCRMPELKACLESAGFTAVKTLLSSGNVAFTADAAPVDELEQRIEAAMEKQLDRVFMTIVRPSWFLQDLVAAQPFAAFELPAASKHIVAFLRRPYAGPALDLPIRMDEAALLKLDGTEAFAAYVPGDKGPVFMTLLERTLSKAITTRTMETVRKCSLA